MRRRSIYLGVLAAMRTVAFTSCNDDEGSKFIKPIEAMKK